MEIAELKDHFDEQDSQFSDPATIPEFEGPDLLFGSYRHTTKEEILAAFPARPVVDRLVAALFSKLELASGNYL
jgi:hypothetical protein